MKVTERGIGLLVTGSMGSGKTSLIKRLQGEDFSEEYYPTEWFDSHTVTLNVDGESDPVLLRVMDADGARKYENYSLNYYKISDVTIIVYNISDQTSMECVTQIRKDIDRYCKGDETDIKEPCCILVGNQCDMPREINKKDAEIFAEQNNMAYIETSAATKTNVIEMFKLAVKRFREMTKLKTKNTDENVPIQQSTTSQKPPVTSTENSQKPTVTSTENSNCGCTMS